MKWFKHDSNALQNAKIEKLIMKYGIEGYGLYFACVEIIAGTLSAENFTFELKHDAEILGYKFKIDTLRVEEMMKYMVNLGLFEINDNNRITCLRLAKRLDISTSNNPEIKKILSGTDYKKLLDSNSRLDKIRLDKTRNKKSSGFKKPTLSEISEYLKDQQITEFTAEQFYDFYESKNWFVGKNKMVSWKHAIGTWRHRSKKGKKKRYLGTDENGKEIWKEYD